MLFLSLAVFLFLLGCTQEVAPEELSDTELFLEETEASGAVAGQAIQQGTCPRRTPVNSCRDNGDGSFTISNTVRGRAVTRTLITSCSFRGRAENAFQVLGCSSSTSAEGVTTNYVETCSFRCEANEVCQAGFCSGPGERTCTDSDGGDVRDVRGGVTGVLGSDVAGVGDRGDPVNPQTASDSCSTTPGGIFEWVCDAATQFATRLIRDCPWGQLCSEGACVTAGEVCDGADNNRNGQVDEGDACNTNANCGSLGNACASGQNCQEGVCTASGQNCQEGVCTFTELCDNLDNNANGQIDEGCDDDNDNYCDAAMTIVGTPTTCTAGGNDCADNNPGVYPRAEREDQLFSCRNAIDDNCNGLIGDGCTYEYLCNDIDDNADGRVDEGCDLDSDGYCGSIYHITSTPPPAVCPNGGGDCQDGAWPRAVDINPGAAENCFDFVDTNCDSYYDSNVNSGCAPYTCTETETSIEIRAASGQTRTIFDFCRPASVLVQVICRPSDQNYWNQLESNVNSTCPSGTTCTQATNSTPAVCS